MRTHTIFSRFLSALGVPHTDFYSDERFRGMTFKSLFGLSHLLSEYGVENRGVRFEDKDSISKLAPPFLAQTKGGIFVIVTDLDNKTGTVEYDSRGETEKVGLDDFKKAWNGIALLAFPDAGSREPEYTSHHLTEIVENWSKYALIGTAFIAFAWFFVTRQIYSHFSTVLLTVFDCVGLALSYMLLQKSLNIHTAVSEKVCGVLEHGGCDSILKLDVSKLFGVFSWSEVGFGYFGVSLAALLLFPEAWPQLALCNLCCLPFTFWSIWYQKFRARHWCTLCVGVQSTLWLLFFCYLGGGWLKEAFPIRVDFLIMVDIYACVVLLLNLVIRTIKNLPAYENNPHA